MNLPSFSKLLVSLSRESPRLAFVSIVALMMAALAGVGIFYGSQHSEVMAVVSVLGVYAVLAVTMIVIVRLALPFLKH